MENIREEFSKIYDRYIPKIYRFIYLKVDSQETAEDLCSEVFLRTWKQFSNGNKIINIQAFLYQIARNIIADHYRSKQQRVTISIEETEGQFLDPADPPQEQVSQSLEMERVRKALQALSDDYQDLIIWRYIDDLSISEIAQISGKSQESVRVGIHRALKNLKKHLESQPGTG